MPRQVTVLTAFVASPTDVEEERNRLEEVIREFNIAWSRELGIHVELVRWESHAFPGFGEDPQSVINEQIPDDYDLFIGIMWYRFGTPTGRAGSGTIEEFKKAKERFDNDPESINLMIYFKDAPAPIAPSKLDHKQIGEIAEFRSNLGNEGGLYWSFASLEDFEKLIRLHLTRHIQSWRSKQINGSKSPKEVLSISENSIDEVEIEIEDEAGLLDYMEIFEEEFELLVEVTENITNATKEIGEKIQSRAEELTQFSSGPDSSNRKTAKRLLAKAAIDMDQYVQRVGRELPLFDNHLNKGMNALIQASQISLDFSVEEENLDQVKENLEAVRNIIGTMQTTEEQIAGFQQTVASLPKMTAKLNHSKRAVVNILQRLINQLQNGQQMAREAEASFTAFLEKG